MSLRFECYTCPPVENLRSKQAHMDPSNWATQYKKLFASVMLPQRKAPNVTAGLTWPCEAFAPTEMATNRPKA